MSMPEVASLDNSPVCIYCQAYAKIHSDYPVNPATHEIETEVPRCEIHAQFTCSHCDRAYHFNGISYCSDCEEFTCLRCGRHSITEEQFLVYDFYYSIVCKGCDVELETLEFSETIGEHPFQIGAKRPQTQLQVWLPLDPQIKYNPDVKNWGVKRIQDMTKKVTYEPVEEREGDSKEVWDKNAEIWKEMTRSGDVNHLEIIIPQMLKYMDKEGKNVMDIACGEGTFSRHVAKAGYNVTGIDVSNLVDYAIETEREEQMGIDYHKVGVHDLSENFEENSFNQVVMNMAIMDIDNLDKILENVKHILEAGGQFVFSLTHPVTAWPTVKTVKLPEDSEKNIDKGWLIDNYANEQPVKVHLPDMPAPMLYYPRKISTYVNTLLKYGFVITGMEEPVPDEETILKYPRDMYQDYDRNPVFMIIRSRLLQK